MQKHEVKQHRGHGWAVQDVSHIHKVDYLLTHKLVKCACGFYGWVENEWFNEDQ